MAAAVGASHALRRLQQRSDNLWYLGVSLELMGTFLNVLGKHAIRRGALHKLWWWYVLGMLGWVILYPVFNILALNYAPTNIVFSVDGIIVVWNVLLAPCTLGEAVTFQRMTASFIITIGTIGAGVFGSHSDIDSTSEEYVRAYSSASATVYYVLLVVVAFTGYLLLQRSTGMLHGFWTGVRPLADC